MTYDLEKVVVLNTLILGLFPEEIFKRAPDFHFFKFVSFTEDLLRGNLLPWRHYCLSSFFQQSYIICFSFIFIFLYKPLQSRNSSHKSLWNKESMQIYKLTISTLTSGFTLPFTIVQPICSKFTYAAPTQSFTIIWHPKCKHVNGPEATQVAHFREVRAQS